MGEDKEQEVVTRIMNHMNKDHVANMEDYLVVYGNVAEDLAKNSPSMDSMDLSSITVSFINERGGRTSVRIPFKHTLDSFRDARSQFVEMAQEAAGKRGFSEYVVNKIPAISTAEYIWAPIFSCLWFFSAKPNILEGILNDNLHLNPETIESALYYVPRVFQGLVIVHAVEAVLILYPLIRKHRMGTLNKLISLTLCIFNGMFHIMQYKEEIRKASSKPSKTE